MSYSFQSCLNDHEVQGVISILGFNIICAIMYLFTFLIFRKCFGKSARDNAKKLTQRTVSFFHRKEVEQEEMIVNDVFQFNQ